MIAPAEKHPTAQAPIDSHLLAMNFPVTKPITTPAAMKRAN
jgi:hypothetical protein